jgi:hypothetical protein
MSSLQEAVTNQTSFINPEFFNVLVRLKSEILVELDKKFSNRRRFSLLVQLSLRS